jgi:DNA modification methylase
MKSYPKLAIEYVPVEVLLAAPHNSRTHSKKQTKLISESIKRFGMMTPIGVGEDNQIIYGHARAEAARLAGLEVVPIVRLSHLSQHERRAYLLADNRLALEAGWNRELLALELQELQGRDFDLPALGFSLPEIDKLYEDLAESRTEGTDPEDDTIPPSLGDTVTIRGDIWVLGNHRLINGDARCAEDYDLLLAREAIGAIGAIFSDPPYNVKIEGNVSGLGEVVHPDFAMASGEMTSAEFTAFLKEAFAPAAARCRDGAIAFICMDWRHFPELHSAGLQVFDELKNVCVWNKKNAGMGTFYRSKYELVFVFKKGTEPHINTFGLGEGGRHRSNVWDYAGASALSRSGQEELALHPTVKPVALIVDALKDCSGRGDLILDNFGGSGSTLIAAEKCGRHARLIEYDPAYCDTIVRRWEKYTGRTAIHQGSSLTFEEVESRRVPDQPPAVERPLS